jgi:hypothetical protein
MLCTHLRHKNRCAVCKRSRVGFSNGNVVVVTTLVQWEIPAAIARFDANSLGTLISLMLCCRCYDTCTGTQVATTHVAHSTSYFTAEDWQAAAIMSRGADKSAAAALLSQRPDETAAAALLSKGPDETAAAEMLSKGADEAAAAALLSKGAQETANVSAPTRARRIDNHNCG